jgi:DNA repair protein RadC
METRLHLRTFRVVHKEPTYFGKAEGPEDVVPLLRAIFRDACDADREHFVVLAIDARSRIIGYKILTSGTLTAALVAPKDVLGVAFVFRTAAALLVSHSHPSQDPTPSDADQVLTDRLVAAGSIIGVPILDHIIVASSGAPDAPWRSVMPSAFRDISCAARLTSP